MAGRPNILLITTDQHRWDAVGWGGLGVKTPHLDQLAKRGILFDRAYTVNPVCTPARCSMLTGHLPSRHGAYTIGTSLPADCPTVPRRFAEAGYFTSLIGKGHFSSCCTEGMFEAPPNIFDLDFFRRWSGPFYGFDHCQLVIDHGDQKAAASMHYGAWLEDNGIDRSRYFGRNSYRDFGVWDLPEEFHYSTWTADRSLAAIDLARNRGEPFFLWSSFQDPHNPCFVPEPWASLHSDVPVPPPLWEPDEFASKPAFYQSVIDRNLFDAEPMLRVEKPWACSSNERLSPSDYERLVRCYWGMVSLADKNIGRIVAGLEARGLIDQTIIIFTTDHGEYLGNHGHWWKWLAAYEDAQRIPMLVVDPQCATPGTRSNAIQSNLDIPHTVLARAGLALPEGLQGIDQSSAWVNNTATKRQAALIEFRPTEGPFAQTTLVTNEWKIVTYTNPAIGELYHLAHDPNQLVNLWNMPAALPQKATLLAELAAAIRREDGILQPRTMWA